MESIWQLSSLYRNVDGVFLSANKLLGMLLFAVSVRRLLNDTDVRKLVGTPPA
jgi:hypothetical protein